MTEITVTVQDNDFQKLMDFLKTLGSVENLKAKKVESNLPQWQINELDKRLEEHKDGTAEYENWEETKKNLFNRYKH